MADYVNLIGTEDVRRAGNDMASAAERMERAAGHMDEALRLHANRMEELVARLEALAAKEPSDE